MILEELQQHHRKYLASRGLPMVFQQPPRLPAPQDAGRQIAERPSLPNITPLMLGTTRSMLGPPGNQNSGHDAQQAATVWENPSQLISRSIALRQAASASSSSGETRQISSAPQVSATSYMAPADDADRPPRDPVLVPDVGHFPMYEAEMDPTHLTQAG